MTGIYEGQFYLLMNTDVWDEPIPDIAVSEWGWTEPVFDEQGEQTGTTDIHPTWRQLEGRSLGPIRWNLAGTEAVAKMQVLPPMATVGAALVQIALTRDDITLMSHVEVREMVQGAAWTEDV